MRNIRDTRIKNIAALLVACSVGTIAGTSAMVVNATPLAAVEAQRDEIVPNEPMIEPGRKHQLDRSGHTQVGKASFYASRYAGKTMADGTPMRLAGNNAASLTLPLGTTARVVNLETGRSAVVTIRDRGPYVKGRIVDLSPATAQEIGLDRRRGVAPVEVVPLSVPLPDGSVWTSQPTLASN